MTSSAPSSPPAWLVARPIAHRGLHDRAAGIFENTLTAADRAVERGFAIECDVQIAADGEALVFHDFTLDRLTAEAGPVRERPTAQLTGLAIGGTADRIPTLAGLLARIGGRVPLVVEIKSRFDGDLALTRRTVAVLEGYAGPVAVKSFDPAIVAALRVMAPNVPRGIVAQADYSHPEWAAIDPARRHAMAHLLHWPETEPDFVSWNVRDLPHAAPFFARHLGGQPVMTWTVRDDAARATAARHADQMVFEGFVPD